MKTKILLLIVGTVVGAIIAFFALEAGSSSNQSVFQSFTSFEMLNTDTSISCTYPQMLSTYYKDGQVEHSLPTPETRPMFFTYSNFNNPNEGIAELSYIDATDSISRVPLAILHSDDEKIVMIENGGESYITTHTIFKNEGVAIFSKQILFPMVNIPSGTMAMGTCR